MARKVTVSRDSLIVELRDGRTIAVPLSWYPRLQHGTRPERRRWRLIGRGVGIHWPDLDEDVSVQGLLAGKASSESLSSLRGWLKSRIVAKKARSPQRSSKGRL
ncbi:MAG TPA: DUF2442 domain-containing protein [Candidatus Polarisedimenticolia bacterium]|nr:DUF2442 domain-containing protein [Candidatus Polarisedimenticolia bacterium]